MVDEQTRKFEKAVSVTDLCRHREHTVRGERAQKWYSIKEAQAVKLTNTKRILNELVNPSYFFTHVFCPNAGKYRFVWYTPLTHNVLTMISLQPSIGPSVEGRKKTTHTHKQTPTKLVCGWSVAIMQTWAHGAARGRRSTLATRLNCWRQQTWKQTLWNYVIAHVQWVDARTCDQILFVGVQFTVV